MCGINRTNVYRGTSYIVQQPIECTNASEISDTIYTEVQTDCFDFKYNNIVCNCRIRFEIYILFIVGCRGINNLILDVTSSHSLVNR